jgi:hypothetical protein
MDGERIDGRKYALIPKSVIYSTVCGLVLTVGASWWKFTVDFGKLEKEIELVKLRLDKKELNYDKIYFELSAMTKQLHSIEKKIDLKADKKWVD